MSKSSPRSVKNKMGALSTGTPGQVPFSEFGKPFIETIASVEMIQVQLYKAIAPIVPIFSKGEHMGTARPKVGTVTLAEPGDCERVYHVPLDIEIEILPTPLNLGLFDLFSGTATTSLRLTVMTLAPATLYLDIAPLKASDIDLHLWSLDVRNSFLPGLIAGGINDSVKKSPEARTIDLLHMVPESLDGPDPAPAIHGGEFAMLAGPNSIVTGTLTPEEDHTYNFMLEAGEQFELWVYVQSTVPLNFVKSDQYGVSFRVEGENASALAEGEEGISDTLTLSAYGQEYNLLKVISSESSFRAVKAGTYSFSITFDIGINIDPDTPALNYKILQRRHLARKQPPAICFDQFGVNFMEGALTAGLLYNQLNRKLPPPTPMVAFKSSDGEAMVTIIPTITLTQVDPLGVTADELSFRADLDVKLELHVDKPAKDMMIWHIEATLSLFISIHTTLNPPTIAIEVDSVTPGLVHVADEHITLDPKSKVWRIIDQPWVRNLLAEQVQQKISDALTEQLKDRNSRLIKIPDQVADMLKMPPQTSDRSVAEAPTFDKVKLTQGWLIPGHAEFFEVYLGEGEKISFDLELAMQRQNGLSEEILAHFCVCDSNYGIVHEEFLEVHSPPEYKVNSYTSDTITAPEDGVYYYWVKPDINTLGYGKLHYKIAPEMYKPNIDTSKRDKDESFEAKDTHTKSASGSKRRRNQREPVVQAAESVEEPIDEPVIDTADLWLPQDEDRTVYRIAAEGVEVFHFLERCPAYSRATNDHYEPVYPGDWTIENVQDDLKLRVCGTCMRLSGATEDRNAEAWANFEAKRQAAAEGRGEEDSSAEDPYQAFVDKYQAQLQGLVDAIWDDGIDETTIEYVAAYIRSTL